MMFSISMGYKITGLVCFFHLILSLTAAPGPQVDSDDDDSDSDSDDQSPSSYPGFLYHKESQKYYSESLLPAPGSCGRYMLLYKEDDTLAKCKCEKSSKNPGRPLVYNDAEKRCYYAYEQGPCQTGEWFVNNDQNESECQQNPCPVSPSTNDGRDIMPLNFYFTDPQGNCYKTNTSDYCDNEKLRVFFVGTDNQPVCLEEPPRLSYGSPGRSSPKDCPEGTKPEADGGCAKLVSFS